MNRGEVRANDNTHHECTHIHTNKHTHIYFYVSVSIHMCMCTQREEMCIIHEMMYILYTYT